MKLIFLAVGFFFIFNNHLLAQDKCDISNLSIKQKQELQSFWDNLKKAVNNKDKIALEELFHFSFNCSICNSKNSKSPYLVINKKLFYREYYKMFFSDFFSETINRHEILEILKGNILENGSCDYNFSFPIVKPSVKSEGVQGFLTVKEINDKYKVFSVWSVP